MVDSAWLNRFTHCCISVVEDVSEQEAAQRFGAVDTKGVSGRFLETLGITVGDQWPEARFLRRGSWVMAFEPLSIEGTRVEVLRRLSQGTRAMAVSWTGDGMSFFGYADNPSNVEKFELLGDEARDRVLALADQLGVAITDVDIDPSSPNDAACALLETLCGWESTEAVVNEVLTPGRALSVRVLPVLSDRSNDRYVAASETQAQLAATLQVTPRERLIPAVVRRAQHVTRAAGVDDESVVAAALTVDNVANSVGVDNDSLLGVQLRAWQVNRFHSAAVSTDTALREYDIARAVVATLSGDVQHAVNVLSQVIGAPWPGRRDEQWLEDLMPELSDIEVPDSVLQAQLDALAQRPQSDGVPFDINDWLSPPDPNRVWMGDRWAIAVPTKPVSPTSPDDDDNDTHTS